MMVSEVIKEVRGWGGVGGVAMATVVTGGCGNTNDKHR